MGFRDLGFKVAGFPCLALKGGRMRVLYGGL